MATNKRKTDGSGAGMANLFEMVEEVTIALVVAIIVQVQVGIMIIHLALIVIAIYHLLILKL